MEHGAGVRAVWGDRANRITEMDKYILSQQSVDTLIGWHDKLNCFEWPPELPDEERPAIRRRFLIFGKYIVMKRRRQLCSYIAELIGQWYILRKHNSHMSGEQFKSVWRDAPDVYMRKYYKTAEQLERIL